MKNKYALVTSVSLVIMLLISACGIFGDPDVKNVETLINKIGDVKLESIEAIKIAEDEYVSLTEKQKEKVENLGVLTEAKDQYYFLFGKSIYDNVTAAEAIIKDHMSIYKDTWYFGIYGDANDEITVEGLCDEVSINADELDFALQKMADELDQDVLETDIIDALYEDDFSWGLYIIEYVFEYRGLMKEAEGLLTEARNDLKTFEKENPNYEHYKSLVDYYSKENSYWNYAKDPTGSYNSFTETISDYEKTLENLRTDLEFTFGD